MPLRVLAIDTGFYSANDILFYNPDDTGCGSSADNSDTGGSDSSSSDAGYKKRLETTLNFLTGKGLSLAAAAGIAGNLKNESGIEPAKMQGHYNSLAPDNFTLVRGEGFGIAQWTYYTRQDALVAFAKKEGKKINDLGMQLDFMWKEASAYGKMMKRLNTIKSETPYNGIEAPVAAAILFHGHTKLIANNPTVKKVNPSSGFERSGDSGNKVVNGRGGAATKIYNDYKGKIKDGTGITGVGTESLSDGSTGYDCGAVDGDIILTATNFALDKPNKDQGYKSGDYTQSTKDAAPAYIAALDKYNHGANPADCGIFVATVMIASGADKDYPKAGTSEQIAYVKNNKSKYTIIENPKEADLQPGDVLIVHNDSINAHHTLIYTGDSQYPVVEASQDNRVPSVQGVGTLNWILGKSGAVIARLIQ